MRDLGPYGGLGAWIDVYDFAAAYQSPGVEPPLSVADLDDMARRGVKTVFVQAARWDDQSPEGIVDAPVLGSLLIRAHALGMRVVGWYLPRFDDIDRDLARSMLIQDFRADGQQFDGLAIDIEYTQGVGDPVQRNDALVRYSQALRARVGDAPVAAVVLTAVHLEVINPRFWPDFPYRALRDLYDVWMPMAYWTVRADPYKDGYRYVKESVDRLRTDLGQPDVPVAPVGGVADEVTNEQMAGYAKALADTGAVGGSLYDWNTMAPGKQAFLAQLFSHGPAASLPVPPAVKRHPAPDPPPGTGPGATAGGAEPPPQQPVP